MEGIHESVDSNIEVKSNDLADLTCNNNNNNNNTEHQQQIIDAKEVISTHLKASTTLINFKNLDNIINAAILLLSKQTNEFEQYKKKQEDLIKTYELDKKLNATKISELESRLALLEKSSKNGKAEIEDLLVKKVQEVKQECNNEIHAIKTGLEKRIDKHEIIIQERGEILNQHENSMSELIENLKNTEDKNVEIKNVMDEKVCSLTIELKKTRERIDDYTEKLRVTMEAVEKLNGPVEDKSLNRLKKKIVTGHNKVQSMATTRNKLANEIGECTNVIKNARQQISAQPDASSWEQIEDILASMLQISTSLRDTFSPGLTRYAIESVHLEKYLEDLEVETQILNLNPTLQGKLLDEIRAHMMEFQQEKLHRDEMVKQVETLGKSLTDVWRNWAVHARDCAKAMTIEEAKDQIGSNSSGSNRSSGGSGVSKADLDRIRKNAEREAAAARRAAGRVASKKALEETQKQIEATANRLTKAVKTVRDNTEDVATVVKRLEQEFLHANQETEILKSGLATAKNDIIELNNNAMHMQHDIEETRNMIPEPTPPYDDTEIKNQLEFHSKELIDVISGVDTLKESEGKFDAEIKNVFEEHASQIAHLLATKADARSTELALKQKAPIALEHQVKEFVNNLVQKIHDKEQLANKKTRSQRASLEARILKLVTGSLNRIRAQQQQLHQIIGPYNTQLGGFRYKCLACDRPADNYLPFQHGHHEHQSEHMLGDENMIYSSRSSLNSSEVSQSLTISPIPGGKGLQQIGNRHYGGKVNTRMAHTDRIVNFEDPGIQARRNLHTYSPYRTVGAGFRVNNKSKKPLQKEFLVSNSPSSSRKRPQTAPHILD